MERKSYKNYAKEIQRILHEKTPIEDHKISETEILIILRYFNRNILTSLKNKKHVFFKPFFWLVNKKEYKKEYNLKYGIKKKIKR